MKSLIIATSFSGFEYNDDGRFAPGRNLVFIKSDKNWLEIPNHGRYEALPKIAIIVDIAASMNIVSVQKGKLTPIQGFELVLLHELVHASIDDESYDKEEYELHHTGKWNRILIPVVREYCTIIQKETHSVTP